MQSFITCLGMLFLLLSSAHTATSQTEHYGYAYLAFYGGSQAGQLVIVNPDTLQVENQLLLPLPSDFRHTRDVSLSPDGLWLIYQVEQSDDININRLMLFNLQTLEVREIPLPSTGRADSQLFAWSPDSTYFTFAFIPLDRSLQNGPYIYNIAFATLDEMEGTEYRIASLSQSHQDLLLTSVIMLDGANYIEIYDSAQGGLIERYTLPQEPFRWIRSCNHTWSPDHQRIAFGSSCRGMSLTRRTGAAETAAQELRILDRATGNLFTLTDYTTSLHQQNHTYLLANFQPYWVDNDTLLFGVIFSDNNVTWQGETILYDFSENISTVLRNENLGDWTPNPVYDDIAFSSGVNDDFVTPSLIMPTVQIGTIDPTAHLLSTHTTLPAGCHLSWRPDGTTLATVQVDNPYNPYRCTGRAESITFWRRENGQTEIFQIPQQVNDMSTFTIPLGWTQVNTPPTDADDEE